MREKFFKLLGVIGLVTMLTTTFSGAFAAELEPVSPQEPEETAKVVTPEASALKAIEDVTETKKEVTKSEKPKVEDLKDKVPDVKKDKPTVVPNSKPADVNICHFNHGTKMWNALTLPENALNGHDKHPNDKLYVEDVNEDGVFDEKDCGDGIGGGCELGDVVLKSPANGATKLPTEGFDFDWYDVEGATSYTIVVSLSQNLSNPIINQTVNQSHFNDNTINPGEYYWQVTAHGEGEDCHKASAVWTFSTGECEEECPPGHEWSVTTNVISPVVTNTYPTVVQITGTVSKEGSANLSAINTLYVEVNGVKTNYENNPFAGQTGDSEQYMLNWTVNEPGTYSVRVCVESAGGKCVACSVAQNVVVSRPVTVPDDTIDDGIGGGVVVVPAVEFTEGIGGGTFETVEDGIGGGVLPNAGSGALIFTTIASALGALLARKKFVK